MLMGNLGFVLMGSFGFVLAVFFVLYGWEVWGLY